MQAIILAAGMGRRLGEYTKDDSYYKTVNIYKFSQRILSYNYGLAFYDLVFASKIYDRVKGTNVETFSYSRQDVKLWM